MILRRRVEVRGPDLRLWRIGRHWSPWRPHIRRVRIHFDDGWNIAGSLDDLAAGAALAVLVFLLVVLTSPLAGIGVLFAEWMLVLLLIPIAVAYRVVFGRPWQLIAESADGRDTYVASVVGWEHSQRLIEDAAQHIKASGSPPEPPWSRHGPD